jgi:hypothetical protein
MSGQSDGIDHLCTAITAEGRHWPCTVDGTLTIRASRLDDDPIYLIRDFGRGTIGRQAQHSSLTR